MSTVQRVKILDYLPPEQKQKVLMLVQRLKQQSQAKQKFVSLYNSSQQTLQALTLKYKQLEDENAYLKKQIHHSFSIVSQVRANFHAHKHNNNNQANHHDDWEEQEEEINEQNIQETANRTVINKPPISNLKSPLQKYRPPMTSSKKTNKLLNLSGQLNQTHQLSNSKSQDLQDLRKQVKLMKEQKRQKESQERQLKEKCRLVDQIKNRYKQNEEPQSHNKQTHNDAYEEEEQEITHISPQQTQLKTQQLRPSRPTERNCRMSSDQKTNKQQTSFVARTDSKPTKSVKGHIITSQDYGDVLDLINLHNL